MDRPPSPCGRRRLLRRLAAALLLPAGRIAADDDTPRAGDWLVPADGDPAQPVQGTDLAPGAGPIVVLPFDAQRGRARDAAARNRILLIRLVPADLDEATRSRSVGGVLAYSALCTHGACEVREWRPQRQRLLCPCHFSQFDPLRSGAVTAGPAPRALPHLVLGEVDGRLVLRSGFSERPGAD